MGTIILLPEFWVIYLQCQGQFIRSVTVSVKVQNHEHFNGIRMGSGLILPVKETITIDIEVNFDGPIRAR